MIILLSIYVINTILNYDIKKALKFRAFFITYENNFLLKY